MLALSLAFEWTKPVEIGRAGEPYVASDNAGAVYITGHLPSQVWLSRDWGDSFRKQADFPDSLGDVVVLPRPEGTAIFSYMVPKIQGMVTRLTRDYGASSARYAHFGERPLDREWLAWDPKRERALMVYSDGYIGGPKSKGVFLSASEDEGRSWTELTRIDREPPGTYAIDPHLAVSTDGKVYAMWTTTRDYETVESYRVAVSQDGGKTFGDAVTVGSLDLELGDRQERWMLGCIAASGKDTLAVLSLSYVRQPKGPPALVLNIRFSQDGAKTFGPPQSVEPVSDGTSWREAYAAAVPMNATYAWPIQMMPWGAFDAKGRLHVTWFENRGGMGLVGEKALNRWQVRYACLSPGQPVKAGSIGISEPFLSKRPTLDFMCCAVDSRNVYAVWSENRDSLSDWDFTGRLMFARRPLAK